ncbi:MAG: thiolase family protein [Thermoprotei archaeon]|nr:MAG: thiolase family protein [Thermoprotei archaeon]
MEVSEVYVINSALIKIDRHFNKGYKELANEVVSEVISKSGIESIDLVVVSNMLSDCILDQLDISTILMQNLGMTKVRTLRVETGESSGLAALEAAWMAIKSGAAENVLVIGVEKVTEYPTYKINKVYGKVLDYEVEFIRNITPPDYAALVMKAYLKKYGLKREDLIMWPVKMHDNACRNAYAQLSFGITPEKVLTSMVISDPIHLLDTFPLGDGAAALLLTSGKAVSNVAAEPVKVVYVDSAVSAQFHLREDLTRLPATAVLASRLKEKFGDKVFTEAAIELHDSYSIYAYIILEELGLAERGKAYEIVSELEFVNVSGGLKARGHPFGATGVYQVAELHKLVTEGFAGRKFDGKYAIAHSMSGPDYNARVALLQKLA